MVKYSTANPRPVPKLQSWDWDRFWDKVDIGDVDGCWEWKAAKNRTGYGFFCVSGSYYNAHRVAAQLIRKRPGGRFLVCHKCDNPGCVNPRHLFWGTHQENMQDMVRKGRGRYKPKAGDAIAQTPNKKERAMCSESKGNARKPYVRLAWPQVAEIRRLFTLGSMTKREIAAVFDVDYMTIHFIVTGKTWKVTP